MLFSNIFHHTYTHTSGVVNNQISDPHVQYYFRKKLRRNIINKRENQIMSIKFILQQFFFLRLR